MRNFERYASVYDLIYSDKAYDLETTFVVNQLRKHYHSGSSLLDIGCGTGKHLIQFLNMGMDAYGIDSSPEMIAIARKKYPEFESHFRVSEDRNSFSAKSFDYVVSLFHVLSYQVSEKDVKLYFSSIGRHMHDRSVGLFDYWYSPAVRKNGTRQTKKEFVVNSEKIIRTATPEPANDPSVINVQLMIECCDSDGKMLDTFEELHPMRHFDQKEIESFCKEAGLVVVHHGAWAHDSKAPDEDNWGAFCIVKKAAT